VADPVDALILDLLEWIGSAPRPYAEVIDAWRTSCPRLPIWEEANDRGFVERRADGDGVVVVLVTALGRQFLDRRRPPGSAARPS
jgi:D-3-phosphoglycerate dehydrogenase / 2-oxoglutarate reductase